MEQLIFIGIILLFSVLEGLARKKREGGAGDDAPLPPIVPQVRVRRAPEQQLPTYDQDPSFDDTVEAGSKGGAGTATEGLIPGDVWAEIQALARGAPPPTRAAAPRPQPPTAPPEPAPRRSPRPAAVPQPVTRRSERAAPVAQPVPRRSERTAPVAEVEVPVGPEHAIHLGHAGFGKPVQGRLTAFDEHPRRRSSLAAEGLRGVLRGGGAGLRQAVLLHEVLGPPVSLKDDPSAG